MNDHQHIEATYRAMKESFQIDGADSRKDQLRPRGPCGVASRGQHPGGTDPSEDGLVSSEDGLGG